MVNSTLMRNKTNSDSISFFGQI